MKKSILKTLCSLTLLSIIALVISSCVMIIVFNAPEEANAGETIPIELKLKRDQGSFGTTGNSNFTVFVYLSTDRYYGAEDIELLHFQGSDLSNYSNLAVNLNCQIPSNTLSGDYFLIAIPDDGHKNYPNIYSSGETNGGNVFYKKITINGLPTSLSDLVIDNTFFYHQGQYNDGFSYIPPKFLPGSSQLITSSIKNLGGANSEAAQGSIYFSSDPNLSSGDILLSTFQIPAIESQKRWDFNIALTLPNNNDLYAAGALRYLIFKIDDQGTLPEFNENNNTISRRFQTERPNMQILNADLPIIVETDTEIEVQAMISNNSFVSNNSTVRIYLSTDEYFSGDDILLSQSDIPTIGVGTGLLNYYLSTTVTIPDSIPTNEYNFIFHTYSFNSNNNTKELRSLVLNYGGITPYEAIDQYLIQTEERSVNSNEKENQLTVEPKINIDVFPNPASEYLNMSISNPSSIKDAIIELNTANGILVNFMSISELAAGTFEKRIPLHQLEPGTYFISLLAGEEIYTKQFVVQ